MIPNIPIEKAANNNTVQHWGFFTPEEVAKANRTGEILMLDIDFGRRCSLHCPGCFRRQNQVDGVGENDLSYHEILAVLSEAHDHGLRSVKICGAGEPFEDPGLLTLATDLTKMNVGLAIFTKGHVIGDDAWTARVFGGQGIIDGLALCQEIFKLKTSVMLYYSSLSNDELFSRLVGDQLGHHAKHACLAAERLALAGFNKISPTRLAFVNAPITKESIGDAFEVYRFARERNILPVTAFHMVSGKQVNKKFLLQYDPTDEQKIDLFRLIYRYNIEHGIQAPEQIAPEGISCMPGIHPCNQIAVGLYLTANGNVIRCPGDCDQPLGNIRSESIMAIWNRVRHWPFAGKFNCGCPYKDGLTIPSRVYTNFKEEILK